MPISVEPVFPWAKDYDLEAYPGTVYPDGVGAMINLIMQSTQLVTIVVVGPLHNIEEALKCEPEITTKARVVAISGSIEKGYDGKATPDDEYNVRTMPSS